MKKLIANTYITSSVGFPVKGGTWDFLQEAHQETAKAIVDGLLQGSSSDTIIYGCEYSDDGVNYTVTAGAIYHSGEIFLVDAVGSTALPTGSDLVIYKLATTFATSSDKDPVSFAGGGSNNVHSIRKIVIQTGTAATSGYLGDYDDLIRYGKFTDSGIVFATVGSTTWANTGSLTEAGYCIKGDVVYLSGNVTGDIVPGSNVSILTLPAAARPAAIVRIAGQYLSGSTIVTTYFEVNTSGVLSLSSSATTPGVTVPLDGISFRRV